MIICIAGSRIWSDTTKPLMIEQVYKSVMRCIEAEYNIIVGDASGVDSLVVAQCVGRDIPYACYGIAPNARNCAPNYYQLDVNGYIARDRHMIDECDWYYGIWNGESKGTLAGFNYAKSIKKNADIWRPRNG